MLVSLFALYCDVEAYTLRSLPDRIPKPIFQYCEKEYLEMVFHQQCLTIHLYLQVGEGV